MKPSTRVTPKKSMSRAALEASSEAVLTAEAAPGVTAEASSEAVETAEVVEEVSNELPGEQKCLQTPTERHVAMTWMQRLNRVFNIGIETYE